MWIMLPLDRPGQLLPTASSIFTKPTTCYVVSIFSFNCTRILQMHVLPKMPDYYFSLTFCMHFYFHTFYLFAHQIVLQMYNMQNSSLLMKNVK